MFFLRNASDWTIKLALNFEMASDFLIVGRLRRANRCFSLRANWLRASFLSQSGQKSQWSYLAS